MAFAVHVLLAIAVYPRIFTITPNTKIKKLIIINAHITVAKIDDVVVITSLGFT